MEYHTGERGPTCERLHDLFQSERQPVTDTSLVIKPLFLVLVVQAPLTRLKHAPPVPFFHIRLVQTGSSCEVRGYTARTQVQLQGPFRLQRYMSVKTSQLRKTGMLTCLQTLQTASQPISAHRPSHSDQKLATYTGKMYN